MIKYEQDLSARVNGNNLQPLAGAEVRVTDKATGLPAALYQDDELTPIPQPLVTTNTGYFGFKAANGEYELRFSPGPNSSRFDSFTRECELYDADDVPNPVSVVLSSLGAEDGAGKVGHNGKSVAQALDDLLNLNGAFTSIDAGAYPSTSLEYKSEPSLVVTKSEKILAFYRIGAAHENDATNQTGYLVCKTYDPRTNVWSNQQTVDSQAGFDTRNQVAGISETTGRLFCLYVQNERDGSGDVVESTRRTYLKYSDDDGATWSARVNISNACPYPTLDNVPFGKIIAFSDGSLMVSIYNYHTIFTIKSTDNGATWGNPVTVYTTPNVADDNITEPTLIKVSDSNIVCIGRCITTGLSQDGSVVWSFQGKRRVSSTRYEVGMMCSDGGRVYRCTVAGTTSATGPTHTSGTAADGTVTWEYVGTYTDHANSTAYAAGAYVETYSTYLYRCDTAGTTGTSAPFASTLGGEETDLAYFKSDNGGVTWSSASKVKWTSASYRVTTSPPTAIIIGSTVHIAWFARSPEWSLYHVKMQARAFFENPAWAFSKTDGEPRSRLMRSLLAPAANAYDWRTDCGYVSLEKMPGSRDVLAAWYDKPSLAAGKTTLYSTVIHP